ncbi:hypothetical protein PRZ48_003946 [Zasmidium cellare]|uniref:Uncharacterized protein n=1 Tax=Zasmidium cellare TaxID=395010 RepID=A0ABR0EWI1_ZASCE|nr:hypothetical protein PRZ48_003946 [Zasmidium cellare]
MLSIPLIPPSDDNSAFLRANYRPRAESPPPLGTLPAIQQQPQTHRQRQQRDEERKQHNARSPLAQLNQSENSIEHHKAQIRNWGSSWIRPPGVTKTLQAMNEEAQEREEQAELERQEANVRDMQAQQQLQDAQQQAQDTTQDVEEERDLDGEIPNADDDEDDDLTFNEDSMMEGSQLDEGTEEDLIQDAEQEEAELTGAAQDEEDLGMDVDLDAEVEVERNLDDSIPEAGSYQHTDTEVEDSDSDSESLQDSPGRGRSSVGQAVNTPVDTTNMHPPPQMAGFQQRMRAQVGASDSLPRSPGSLNLSSSILDSSLVGSSPVVQRGNARGRGSRSRRGHFS